MNKMTTDNTAILNRRSTVGNEQGVALIMSLIITLVVFLLIMSTIYVTTTSTKISGAGKRFATASEAADGAVEVMKDAINLITYSEPIDELPLTDTANLLTALSDPPNNPTKVTLDLAGTSLFTTYTAEIIVERLYSKNIPGSRAQHFRSTGVPGGKAVFYRINAVVTGPNNSRAETTALYRFVG
jgi:Tfp pilus assembly protein PilX